MESLIWGCDHAVLEVTSQTPSDACVAMSHPCLWIMLMPGWSKIFAYDVHEGSLSALKIVIIVCTIDGATGFHRPV